MEKVRLISVDALSKKDFNNICRLCMMQGPIACIFNLKYEETLFSDILFELFSTQVNSEDEMPKNVCATCISEIIRFYNFRKVLLDTETILQLIITNEQNKSTHMEVLIQDEIVVDDFVTNATSNKDLIEDLIEVKEDPIIKEDAVIEINNITTDSEKQQEDCIIETVNNDFEPQHLDNGVEQQSTKPKKLQGRVFTCSCMKTFTLQSQYIKHRTEEKHQKNSRPRNQVCKICNKSFTKYQLLRHQRTHTKEKPYDCKMCLKRFSQSGSLKRHMMIHTGERPHVCEICGKSFNQRPTLVDHKRIHTGEKPYLCTYCGKTYGNRGVYKFHLNKHLDGKDPTDRKTQPQGQGGPHQCEVCQKVFSSKGVLKTHLLRHGEKKFLCSYCGKSFHSNAALQQHQKVHTGAKPYACTFCDRAFSQRGSLKMHVWTHTGVKPYQCEICSKAFTQKHHLGAHLRTHSGEKPYVCTFCGKSFCEDRNFRAHVRTHTGERPFTCDLCPMGFEKSGSLKRHKRRHLDQADGEEKKVEI